MEAPPQARSGAMPRIRMPSDVLDVLRGRARQGYPHEVCGLLIGEPRPDDAGCDVVRATSARNLRVDRARDRYELDPADQLAAEQAARREGHSVVGVWHSHPDHPARPSERDRAVAWERWSYVIVSVDAAGACEIRSWRLRGASFVEEVLE